MNQIAGAFSRAAGHDAPTTIGATPMRWVRDDRFLLPVGLMIWVLTVLMIVPEGFDYGSLASAEAPRAGSMVSRLLWLALLGFSGLLVAWRAAFAWRFASSWLNPFLLFFVMLAIASIAWSIEPMVTSRRLIRMLTIVLASIAFVVVGWHSLRFQNVVRPILTFVLLGSIIFGLAAPHLAIHQEAEAVLAGAWHGLANHKNALGNLACIAMIFWFHALLSRQVRWPMALLGCGVALTCLLLASSATALVTTVFTLMFLVMLMQVPTVLRRYLPWLVALFVSGLLIYSLALLEVIPGLARLLGPIGVVTGKDMTFTGRTEIWEIMTAEIARHPLLGVGYGAYWTGPVLGTPVYEFVRLLNFYPASAHNGYLDILNDLGALGLLVLFGYLVSYIAQSLRLLAMDRAQAALYLALFLQQAITNLSESRWLSVQSVDFVLMTLATAALARSLLEQRLHRQMNRRAPSETAGADPHMSSITATLSATDNATR